MSVLTKNIAYSNASKQRQLAMEEEDTKEVTSGNQEA